MSRSQRRVLQNILSGLTAVMPSRFACHPWIQYRSPTAPVGDLGAQLPPRKVKLSCIAAWIEMSRAYTSTKSSVDWSGAVKSNLCKEVGGTFWCSSPQYPEHTSSLVRINLRDEEKGFILATTFRRRGLLCRCRLRLPRDPGRLCSCVLGDTLNRVAFSW
jgi:hypothetical protein